MAYTYGDAFKDKFKKVGIPALPAPGTGPVPLPTPLAPPATSVPAPAAPPLPPTPGVTGGPAFSPKTPGQRNLGPVDGHISQTQQPGTSPGMPPPIPGVPPGAPSTPAPAAPTPGTGTVFQGSPEQKLDFIAAHPEQFDHRISREQWQAWLPDLDTGCPGRKPFRTGRPGPGGATFSGPERCVEKPDDCPEGFRVIGNGANAKCIPQDAAEFGGGGAGGGGSYGGPMGGPGGNPGGGGPGGGGGPVFNPGAGFGGIDAQLQALISGNLNGQNSRYSPSVVGHLLSGAKASAEDQNQQNRQQIMEDAAARGVLGAGATGNALIASSIGANRQVADARNKIESDKINADFQDKRAAMQDAFEYLNSARDWAYKQQMTAMQRQQFDANLQLAYARMQQEWDQMQAQAGYRLLGS